MAYPTKLEEILFRHCAKQCRVSENIPFESVGHRFECEKHKMLYDVIEEANLTDEYHEWKKAQGYV